MGGVVSADDDTDDQGDGTIAEVRVGHLSPDAPNVDVYVGAPGLNPKDEDTHPNVEGLEYSKFAPNASGKYLDLEAGTYDISVTAEGDPGTEPVDVDGFELDANKDYTILAVGELEPEKVDREDEPGVQALPLVDNDDDETALPPADAALVRLVHASPDAGEVDLVVKQAKEEEDEEVTTIEDVTFTDATDYLELPPGDYTVDVGPSALEVDVTLEAGTKVSGYVIGTVSDKKGDAELSAVTTLEATNPGKDRGDDDGEDDEDDDDEEDEDDGDDGHDGDNGDGEQGRGDDDGEDDEEDDGNNGDRGRGGDDE